MAEWSTPQTPPSGLGDEDARRRLEAVRDDLAGRIPAASDRDVAPLIARYQAVLRDLRELGGVSSDELDDLEAARRRRRAAASD